MGIAFRFDNHPVTKQGIMSAINSARLARLEAIQPIHAMRIWTHTLTRTQTSLSVVSISLMRSQRPVHSLRRERSRSPVSSRHSFRYVSLNGITRSTSPLESRIRISSALRIIDCLIFVANTGSIPGASHTFHPLRCGLISITVIGRDSFKF